MLLSRATYNCNLQWWTTGVRVKGATAMDGFEPVTLRLQIQVPPPPLDHVYSGLSPGFGVCVATSVTLLQLCHLLEPVRVMDVVIKYDI